MEDYKNYIIWKAECTPNLHMKAVILGKGGKETFQVPTFDGGEYTGKDVPMKGTNYFTGTFRELADILTGKVKGVLSQDVIKKISCAHYVRVSPEFGIPFGYYVTFGNE